MNKNRYCIGIDLGTSNSALSTVDLEDSLEPQIVPIGQIAGLHAVADKNLLPSAAYFLLEGEQSSNAFVLPWGDECKELVIGEYARDRGATLPDRLASSVKSWLCNPHIDRKAPQLPWRSSSVSNKYSPFALSRCYLEHLKNAVFHYYRVRGTNLAEVGYETVLTVPASFDEIARNLTLEAACEAGFSGLSLLEEPQAAFYSWLAKHSESWREHISPGDLVLVCDVGGGTADFSLIAVTESAGELALERVSVGDHILLGGDNIDLALAYALRGQPEVSNQHIDDWQFLTLIHASRSAKERLLSEDELEKIDISIPSRGSSLFASTISVSLTKALVEEVVMKGFFPLTRLDEMPIYRSTLGLQEFGLNYAADAAFSKHLARFLFLSHANVKSDPRLNQLCSEHCLAGELGAILPNKVLFNGGVFKSRLIRRRVLDLLGNWDSAGQKIKELPGADFDLAVAKGAAHYAALRSGGKGLRIKAGLARSYYLGLETSMLAVPGLKPPVKGVCVVPQGTEEGSTLTLSGQEFGLITGQPATFRFFSSTSRAGDKIGGIVSDAERELTETSSLTITLPAVEEFPLGTPIPVRMESVVTDIGTLELYLHHLHSENRWKLEFSVRNT